MKNSSKKKLRKKTFEQVRRYRRYIIEKKANCRSHRIITNVSESVIPFVRDVGGGGARTGNFIAQSEHAEHFPRTERAESGCR
jgi:hypothetical protein